MGLITKWGRITDGLSFWVDPALIGYQEKRSWESEDGWLDINLITHQVQIVL